MTALSERLGFRASDRVVILSGVARSRRQNRVTSRCAHGMVTISRSWSLPWGQPAAAAYRVIRRRALTLNSTRRIPWGPIPSAALWTATGPSPDPRAWWITAIREAGERISARTSGLGLRLPHLTSHWAPRAAAELFASIRSRLRVPAAVRCPTATPSGTWVSVAPAAADEGVLFPTANAPSECGKRSIERDIDARAVGHEIVVEPAPTLPNCGHRPRGLARVEHSTRHSDSASAPSNGLVKLALPAARDSQRQEQNWCVSAR